MLHLTYEELDQMERGYARDEYAAVRANDHAAAALFHARRWWCEAQIAKLLKAGR